MRERKLYEKKRARKGSGRAKTIPVQVSAELHGELSMIKDAYSKCLGRPVTFEQMLRRWIDRLPRIDSDVNDEYQVIRKARQESESAAVTTAGDSPAPAEDQMQSPEPVATPEVPVDPTEGEVWNMRYFFEKDGDEIEAYTGYWPGFFAEVDGEERNQDAMMADGWVLMNDAGIEISPTQAMYISIRIKSLLDSSVGAIEDESFFPEEEVKEEEVMPVPEAATVDPTEGAVWDMRYYFVKDGEELDALVGDKAAFYCKLNGRNTGMATMMNSGWKLVNEAGVELTKSQAAKIREIIKSHNTEK